MNRTYPLVSIGIPTFNRPESLRRSLDCISQQTYPNLEIIVSDNASPGDETRSVVEDCMAKDGRIRYFRQSSNLGPVANFQFVLDAATGEYFMWMSDDDWRAPSYIEELLRALQADGEAVLAFCDIAVLDESGNRRNDFYRSYRPYLRKLVSDMRWIRLSRFFLQDEGLGKANLVYGLMRRNAIANISLVSMLNCYGFYGLDNLIVFILLGKGRLKLVEGKLYGCTAGNVKHYATTETSQIKRRLQAVADQFKYLLAYLKLANNAVRPVFAILFPIKLALFYLHVFRRKFAYS